MSARTSAAAVIVAALATPALAADVYRGRTISEVYREGFLIGFSVGAGGIAPDPCDQCGLAAGAELHVGAMASREVGVMLEAGGLVRGDLDHAFLVAAAQWWPDPAGRFWAKGGLGIGARGTGDLDPLDFSATNDDYVYPTLLAAGGFEVVRSGRFTIDLQVRGAATKEPRRWSRSGSVSIGLNWY
jgi:hypothetical protein